ncbi:hypothetical protein H072_7767 [Dactylellina haptotyla CBS 200.50]|uniref:Uncharacterized protein n=1 Tax=Dactylellina haptotyla (strain CBS 200.50) TaxID=1284197 RepID=S8BTC5_DACHA|nr:hypothetical protein H072_7767 [Dactylellina haptotyla CBS 200.50]
MELRVLIPVGCVLGVLLLVTIILVIVIIARKRRIRQKSKEWQQHGVVEDNYSISWSDPGLSRGVSVRSGKLVRSQSKRRVKDAPKTTVESVRDDNENHAVKRDMGSLQFMNSISHITGRISPGIGRALSVGSHKTSINSSEKSRQISPMPTTDEESGTSSLHLVDISKRPSSSNRRKSPHSRSSSKSNLHDMPVPEDMTLQGRDSILLPSPPSSVHILTPTHSRHSRQSQSHSSFTFTPVTPRASVSLFPLSAPPGQQRRPSAAAQAATASLANHVFPGNTHNTRRPSFLQNSITADRLPTTPSTSVFDSSPATLAQYADELAPRQNGRPKVSQIQIPASKGASPRAPSSAAHGSSDSGSPVHDELSRAQNFENWSFSPTESQYSGFEDENFPTPYNEVSRPQYMRAPSSAVGNPMSGGTPPRKESFASYAQMRRESMRRDSFGGAMPVRRESHGLSTLRRDSTTSFMSSTPKFATGPRVYRQSQLHPDTSQQGDALVHSYSDHSLQSNYMPQHNERQLDPMNIIPSVNESKSSIVSLSSTGSAGSDGFTANGGLSPPPLQKASFESTRAELTASMEVQFSTMVNTRLQQSKPPVTPPQYANGKPFGVFGGQGTFEISPSHGHRRLAKGFVPETVAETNENVPPSPTSTITTETVTETSGEGMSPDRAVGGVVSHN